MFSLFRPVLLLLLVPLSLAAPAPSVPEKAVNPAYRAERPHVNPDAVYRALAKRDDPAGTLNLTFGNDGGVIGSDLPLPCLEGCLEPLSTYFECNAVDGDGDPSVCPWLCDARNYTQAVACWNCLIANGEQDTDKPSLTKELDAVNAFCANDSASSARKSIVSSITAIPTTTGPFTVTFSGSAYTLPTWTGLASFVATDTQSSGIDPGSSAINSQSSVGSVTTPSSVASSPTNTARSSSISTGTPTRSASATPTISQGAGVVGAKVGKREVLCGVLAGMAGLALA